MNRLETWRIRAGVRCTAVGQVGGRLLARQIASGPEATVKVCGVVVAMLPGQQVGASLVDRCAVNVGTIHCRLVSTRQVGAGQARRRADGCGWGGGLVVVGVRESRSQGEGGQWVYSTEGGMSGDALVNTGATAVAESGRDRVLKIQAKLHLWAKSDPDRRFGDLFNLVADPAFLMEAWARVRGNKGARSAGVPSSPT